MKAKTVLLLTAAVLLVSCKSIDQSEAESNALDFVNSNVVFYTKQNASAQTVEAYNTQVISSNRVGDKWHVSIEVSSTVNNTEKSNTLPVVLDASSGNVIEFNNMPVAQR